MKLYTSNDEAIQDAISLLSDYPNLQCLIDGDDLSIFWLDWLKKHSIDANDLLKKKINVLSILMIVSIAKKNDVNDSFMSQYEGFLESLNRAIGNLVAAGRLDCFKDKLRNPAGTHTISCFSELFLAEHFQKKGFEVSFEFPFQLVSKSKGTEPRNFDIALAKDGQSYLVEVYTPIGSILEEIATTDEAFFGIDGAAYPDFLDRIRKKAAKKFGFEYGASIKAPNCPKVLAINARYYDSVSFDLVLAITADRLFADLRSMFSDTFPLDAMIIFQTNDTHPAMPVQFHRVVANPKTSILNP